MRGQVRTGQLRTVQVRRGQVKTGGLRKGGVRTDFLGTKKILYPNYLYEKTFGPKICLEIFF